MFLMSLWIARFNARHGAFLALVIIFIPPGFDNLLLASSFYFISRKPACELSSITGSISRGGRGMMGVSGARLVSTCEWLLLAGSAESPSCICFSYWNDGYPPSTAPTWISIGFFPSIGVRLNVDRPDLLLIA